MEGYKKKYMLGACMHDNDFISTIQPFLNLIKNLEFEPTKEQIQLLWNELSYGLYLANQCQFEYGIGDNIKDYLLSEMKFYINEEVVEYLEKCEDGWDNAEFNVLDKNLPEDQQVYFV